MQITNRLTTIVFDVDGTLYRQAPLRRAMLLRLLAAHAVDPVKGWRTMTALQAYRRAQEHLRGHNGDMAAAQMKLACERAGVDETFLAGCVERWMEQAPLALLARYIQPGLIDFLDACRARGLRLGVLSDYPAEAKLQALGIAGYFDVTLCAQSAEIGAFKPDPRGLRVALERLGSAPEESLYVGDRAEVDATAAAAAGIPCAIITRPRGQAQGTHIEVDGYAPLQRLVFGDGRVTRPSRGFNQVA